MDGSDGSGGDVLFCCCVMINLGGREGGVRG